MKTKEEIRYICGDIIDSESVNEQFKQAVYEGAILGYTQCQEDMAKESIAFANFLKADFEMEDSGSSDDILWLLCGTRQTYTTDEIYNEFIKSRSLINSQNKQD